jgi:uncharacterized membrane protein YfcA
MPFVLAIVLAVLVGISLGVLGGGGSILTVPILRYALGMEAHRAIAVSLLVVGTTSLFALIPHARAGRVRWRTGLVFGAAGMLGAYLAGSVARFIPATFLLVTFGLMMLATAVAMLRERRVRASTAAAKDLPVFKVIAEGLVVGAVTGLVGAGGGFLVVPALVLLGGLPMEVAVGTSLVVISMKSFAGLAGFLGHTPIDWKLALAISAAAVAGSVIGASFIGRVSPTALRRAFGWFVVAMALFILTQELPGLLGRAPSVHVAVLVALLGSGAAFAIRRYVSLCFARRRKSADSSDISLGTGRVTPEVGGKA